MKPSTLLLAASLLANVAFLSYLATRPAETSVVRRDTAVTAPRTSDAALRAALASGDARALEAAGVPADVAREIALGRRFARLAAKLAAQTSPAADERWWRTRPGTTGRETVTGARRELADALREAFGDDFGVGGDPAAWSFLPAAKRDALRRITQDYDEMMAKFSAGGVQLASDRERLKLLRQERDRDIAALLSPDELAAYEMRTSASAASVRNRCGDAIESEAEFQKLYALQKAFDEKYPRDALVGRISPETLRARSEAERQLENDLRAAVGDDRYATLRRAADPDVRAVDGLAARLNLPATTTDTVLATRDALAAESQRIANDASISPAQRRAQIQELAGRARNELTQALGAEASDAYTQRSPWVSMLSNGMAYTTTPPEGTPASLLPGNHNVYPVALAGASGPAQRQFVINAPGPDGDATSDAAAGNVVRVMSFSTTTSTDGATRPAGTAATPAPSRTVAPPTGRPPQ